MSTITDSQRAALVRLIQRAGANNASISYLNPEPEVGPAIVWLAVAEWTLPDGEPGYKLGIGLTADDAFVDLAERTIDGGLCAHCLRMSVLVVELDDGPQILGACVTSWDPELSVYRRDCEGG